MALFPVGGEPEAPPCHHGAVGKALALARDYARGPSLRVWHQFDLALHAGAPRWAMPIFELDSFTPVESAHLRGQDGLLACSAWAEGVLSAACPGVPVRRVPLGVDSSLFPPTPLPESGPTTFLTVGKLELRKGHDVIIEAFSRAFSPADDVRLVMHCHNPCLPPADSAAYNRSWERAALSAPMGGKTEVSVARLGSQKEVAALMAAAHVGLFPSRAEGWGLESLEMMSMGRHVVLTACTGHLEFASGGLPIPPGPPEDAFDGVWFRGQGRWASLGAEQEERLIGHVRELHRLRLEGRLRPNVAGVAVAASLSWENSARRVREALLGHE